MRGAGSAEGRRPPMRRVIDASVAAKWLAPEPESPQADRLLDDELLVPSLLFADVANVLWKKQAKGEMDIATVAIASQWLLQLPLQVHDCASLMKDALDLAVRLRHPAYDCFYLALARQTDCPLVTADRRMLERCRRPDVKDLAARIVFLPDLGGAPDLGVAS